MLASCLVSAGVAQGFGRFTYPVLLPQLRADLLRSYAGAGFMGTLNVGAYLVGSLVVMAASLRHPGHRVMGAGMVVVTVALFVLATARGSTQLAVGMVLSGLGGAGVWVPAAGVATSLFPPARKGMAAGLVGAGIGLGILIASQLAKLAPRWWGPHGWRTVWLLMACASVVATIAQFVVLHPPEVRFDGDPPTLAALRRIPGWWRVAAAYFAFGYAYIVVITYMGAALVERGYSPARAANAFAVLAFTNIFGGTLLGPWSDRVGRRFALVAAFVASGVAAAALVTGWTVPVLIGAGLFGVTFGGGPALIVAYVGDHTPARSFGSAFGAVTVAFAVAQAVGPQLGGWLRDGLGSFTAVFVSSAVVFVVGAVLCWGLEPGTRGRALADHRTR